MAERGSKDEFEKKFAKLVDIYQKKVEHPDILNTDIAKLFFAHLSVYSVTGKVVDRNSMFAVTQAVLNSGRIPNEDLVDAVRIWGETPNPPPRKVDEISQLARLGDAGVKVGLKFGHYRRLTVTHIMELIAAGSGCDHLALVIESNQRTLKNKTDKLELTDGQRFQMISMSGLVDSLWMTTGDDYSDAYYRDIVLAVKPSVLYASATWSPERLQEYQHRADSVGAELITLGVMGPSTTQMERFLFN